MRGEDLKRSLAYIILIIFIVVSLLGVASASLTKFLLNQVFSVKSNVGDWIGYAGNIIGGILGGAFTLLGVGYAFGLERKKQIRDEIPTKILNLYIIKEKLSTHKFRSFNNYEKEEFMDDIERFLKDKNELLEKSSYIDTDIFNIIDHYIKSLKSIKIMNTDEYIKDVNYDEEQVKKRRHEAAQFHTYQIEIVNKKIEIRTKKYLKDFHNKRKSKNAIKELDNHSYLHKRDHHA